MKQQRGAVLVVSLLLLLVMTLLALGASQTTRLQERMSAGMRDRDLAFESSEAGLRNGERIIDSLAVAPSPCTSGRCQVYDRSILPTSMAFQTPTWWNDNSWSYVTDETFTSTHTASSGGDQRQRHGRRRPAVRRRRAGGRARRLERAADRATAEPHLLPHHIGGAGRLAAGAGRAAVDVRSQVLRHMACPSN